MKSRTRARSIALQALYEIDLINHPPASVIESRVEETALSTENAEFARHNFLFDAILDLKSDSDRRLNTHPLEKYDPLPISIDETPGEYLSPVIFKIKEFYFKKHSKPKSKLLEKEIEELLLKLFQDLMLLYPHRKQIKSKIGNV